MSKLGAEFSRFGKRSKNTISGAGNTLAGAAAGAGAGLLVGGPPGAIIGGIAGGVGANKIESSKRRERKKNTEARNQALGQISRAEGLFSRPIFSTAPINTAFDRAQQNLRANFASRGLFRSGGAATRESGLDLARGRAISELMAQDERQRRAALTQLALQRAGIVGTPIQTPQADANNQAFASILGSVIGSSFNMGGLRGAFGGGGAPALPVQQNLSFQAPNPFAGAPLGASAFGANRGLLGRQSLLSRF